MPHDEPKLEYCGPYLIALPAPSFWGKYIPSVPPYRICVTRLHDGMEYTHATIKDRRTAITRLRYLQVGDGYIAEVLDANDSWLMRVRGNAAVPSS